MAVLVPTTLLAQQHFENFRDRFANLPVRVEVLSRFKSAKEQKQILDFVCQKAIYTKDTMVVEAWFTPQIPIANGPDLHGQLPGMILMVSMENGKRTITATEVKFEKIDSILLEKPTKGKKISQAEFKKIQEEKMKEMGGGNGRTVIRIEIDDRG